MKRKLLCLVMVLAILLSIPVPGYAASSLKISNSGIAVIKELEGFRATPYVDTNGKYTVGYGTQCTDSEAEYYKKNPITEKEADQMLRNVLVDFEKAVNSFADKHGLTLTQGQFDGIVSLVFNCGYSWLTKGNTLIKALTEGYTGSDLVYAFSIYSMSGGNRSIGHVKRRLAEANMYLYNSYSHTPPDYFSYVLYDGNGGEISSYNVQGYDFNDPVAPVPTATYEGKNFLGWYTKASGGVKVTKLDASTKAMTLYAHWGTGTQTEEPEETEPLSKITGSLLPSGKAIGSVKVTVTNNGVNLRKGPGTGHKVVGTANKSDQFTIIATYQDSQYLWGRYAGGWICLKYTDYKEQASEEKPKQETTTVTKTYATVVNTDKLNVRSTPDGTIIGGLAKGTKVEILEKKMANDRLWGRYTGGWICLGSYVKLETVTQVVYKSAQIQESMLAVAKAVSTSWGVITADQQNVYAAPGEDQPVVAVHSRDEEICIYESTVVDGLIWGRTDEGWICVENMKF